MSTGRYTQKDLDNDKPLIARMLKARRHRDLRDMLDGAQQIAQGPEVRAYLNGMLFMLETGFAQEIREQAK